MSSLPWCIIYYLTRQLIRSKSCLQEFVKRLDFRMLIYQITTFFSSGVFEDLQAQNLNLRFNTLEIWTTENDVSLT
jgi:hypothetical protein